MAEDTAGLASLEAIEQWVAHGELTHLPVWGVIDAEQAEAGIRTLLAVTGEAFGRLETEHTASWQGLMAPLERLYVRLGRVVGAVTHLLSVKYSDELQAAYDAVRPEHVTLSNTMAQSRAVYDGMRQIRDGAQWGGLNPAQQRIVSESIRGMERSGVHLEGAVKDRYQKITEDLSELSNRFQTNLVKEEKASRIIETDPLRVHGMPAAVLSLAVALAAEDGVAGASADAGPWHFVVNGVNYLAAVEHAADRSFRESFYRAYRARGCSPEFDNRPILEQILQLRQEEASLVGFAHYADLSIDSKMAPDTAAVWQLINEIESAARPVAESEFAALVEFMGREGAAGVEPAAWDIAFWTEKLREARFDYDSERLRDYFQMPKVLEGLFSLIHDLYAVEIRSVAAGEVPVWDDSVEFFEVLQDGKVIAGFYVDPYARPGEKRGGAWMNTVVGRTHALTTTDKPTLPVALFVMNGRPPVDGKPALMSLDEVRTLFHEFGHATQHMFTDIDEGGASGMNLVEWDAVELASQFNEYWMEHKPFLRKLSAHYDTGEALDEQTLDRIIDSRNFMVGGVTLRQLLLAKTDMVLHERYGLPGVNDVQSPFEIEEKLAHETIVIPLLEGETQLPAFGHLFAGGYAAGYYSYKWAEVLAADAFAAFREAGLDDAAAVRTVALRFKGTILGLGGSLPAAEIYRRFRGRDATTDALLIDQGLRVAS